LPYVLSQHLVDDTLVVAAASAFDLVPEPAKDFVVETDGDARFAFRDCNDSAACGFPEIVFTLHDVPHIDASLTVSLDVLKPNGHDPLATCKQQRVDGQRRPCPE
jgi:hypothetical protein